jgi:heat shock protein HslJ
MACDKLQAETRFIEALGKANRFDIVGGELTLFNGQTPLMKLESYR